MKKIVALFFLVALFNIPSGYTQPGDPDGGGTPGSDPVPLSGVEILLIAGGAFGMRKALQLKSKK
ncbi:MAG: hypothetical protein AAFN93_00180 [Bacteroidota bacterium]